MSDVCQGGTILASIGPAKIVIMNAGTKELTFKWANQKHVLPARNTWVPPSIPDIYDVYTTGESSKIASVEYHSRDSFTIKRGKQVPEAKFSVLLHCEIKYTETVLCGMSSCVQIF